MVTYTWMRCGWVTSGLEPGRLRLRRLRPRVMVIAYSLPYYLSPTNVKQSFQQHVSGKLACLALSVPARLARPRRKGASGVHAD